jgi:hypothetical protein
VQSPGLRRFSAAYGTGATQNVFDYFAQHRTENEWEHGTGHMSDANTLVRDTVIENSNGDTNPVNFSAGIVDIGNDIPGDQQARYIESETEPADPAPSTIWLQPSTGALWYRTGNWWVELGGGKKGADGVDGSSFELMGNWSAGAYLAQQAVYHAPTVTAYIANTDTSNEPPHADWDILAPGADEGALIGKAAALAIVFGG